MDERMELEQAVRHILTRGSQTAVQVQQQSSRAVHAPSGSSALAYPGDAAAANLVAANQARGMKRQGLRSRAMSGTCACLCGLSYLLRGQRTNRMGRAARAVQHIRRNPQPLFAPTVPRLKIDACAVYPVSCTPERMPRMQ